MLLSAASEQFHRADARLHARRKPLKDRMSAFQSNRRRSKLPVVVTLMLIGIAAIAGGAFYLWPRSNPSRRRSPSHPVLMCSAWRH